MKNMKANIYSYESILICSIQRVGNKKCKLININESFRGNNLIGSYYSKKHKKKIELKSVLHPIFTSRLQTFFIFGRSMHRDNALLNIEDISDIMKLKKIKLKKI